MKSLGSIRSTKSYSHVEQVGDAESWDRKSNKSLTKSNNGMGFVRIIPGIPPLYATAIADPVM